MMMEYFADRDKTGAIRSEMVYLAKQVNMKACKEKQGLNTYYVFFLTPNF